MPDERIQPKRGTGGLRVIDGQAEVTGLLVREAASSGEALEKLCAHYIPKIYNFILKRVGNVQDAEDLTSAVFEKVVTNLESFDEAKASFTTWVYRIAINSVTDFYRGSGRRRATSLDDESAFEVAHPADDIDRADLHMVLVDLMKQIPRKYQEAVTLRYFWGLKVAEVADTLGITESAASKRILRGLDELKRLAEGGPLDALQ